jgi:hypothetical protein
MFHSRCHGCNSSTNPSSSPPAWQSALANNNICKPTCTTLILDAPKRHGHLLFRRHKLLQRMYFKCYYWHRPSMPPTKPQNKPWQQVPTAFRRKPIQLLQPGAPCVHFHSTLLAHSYAIRLKCTWVQSSSVHTGITPQAACLRQHDCQHASYAGRQVELLGPPMVKQLGAAEGSTNAKSYSQGRRTTRSTCQPLARQTNSMQAVDGTASCFRPL